MKPGRAGKLAAGVGAALLSTGCTTVWVPPPGKTEADLHRDEEACQHDAEMAAPQSGTSTLGPVAVAGLGQPLSPSMDRYRRTWRRVFGACMEAAGYTKQ